MKVITLHQPWATLVALGVKRIETRSWAPPKALIGERLLIHAGTKTPLLRERVGPWSIDVGASGRFGIVKRRSVREPWETRRAVPLPLGAIVASCILADAVPMVVDPLDPDGVAFDLDMVTSVGSNEFDVDPAERFEDQRPYGDFAPGRWAWLLEDVKPTTERCPACWGGELWADPEVESDWGCVVCDRSGTCPPIPAKGHQRVWEWEV